MRRLMILGNCVAYRLALLLAGLFQRQNYYCPGLSDIWEVIPAKPVYNIDNPTELQALFRKAQTCDLVFSQPLFHFGPLNTESLTAALGDRLCLFSAPNFEAYFPDIVHAGPGPEPEKFPPPLEWHSKIILECRAGGVPVQDVEDLYLNHPLFKAESIRNQIVATLARYEQREQGVQIGTLAVVKEYYAKEALFHTFNHPGDRVVQTLLSGMLRVIGLSSAGIASALAHIPWQDNQPRKWTDWGFGFNAWPIITRKHSIFSFPERAFFRIGGKEADLMSAAIAWFHYYDNHPLTFQKALAKANNS